MDRHYHIIDSGQAVLTRHETRSEAIAQRKSVYADMATFVDSRNLATISRELPIVKCDNICEWED